MKAVGVKQSLPVADKNCFVEFETEIESPKGHDILVEVGVVTH